MFLLDFLNGFEVVACEDFKSHHDKDAYEHNGCMNCDHRYREYHDCDDYDSASTLKYYTCRKTHLLITIQVVIPSEQQNLYDQNGILKYKFARYRDKLHTAFRTNITPKKVIHEQEQCEEITQTVTSTKCTKVKLDGPPEGYEE